jgi:hypothetical protein
MMMTKTRAAIAAAVIVRFLSLAVGFFSLTVVCLFSIDASAAGKARVGVLSLRGAGEGVVRAKISAALKANGFLVVGTEQLESSASGLGVSLDSDKGLTAVARELNVSAFVAGELSKKKASLTVRNGADGSVLGDDSFAGPNPKKIAAAVGSTFWRQLGPAVRQGKPPAGAKTKAVIAEEAPPPPEEASDEAPAAAPPPAEERPRKKSRRVAESEAAPAAAPEADVSKPKAKPAEPEEGGSEGGLPALTVGIGASGMNRSLSWHQDQNNVLAPYSLGAGPQAAVWLEAYPAAFATAGFASRIGIFGGFNQGFGVNSTANNGATKLTTSFQDFLAGAKLRWPVGIFAPYASAAYGAQSFKLTTNSGTAPMIPSVAYKFIRLGIGSRADITERISADLGVGFMLLTDAGKNTGEIKSAAYFPGTTGNAIDVGASVAYRFTKIIGARAGVDFRQYGLSANPANGATLVAGGATDRYIFFGGGIELVLDGVSGAVADDEKEEASSPPGGGKTAPAQGEGGDEGGGDKEK